MCLTQPKFTLSVFISSLQKVSLVSAKICQSATSPQRLFICDATDYTVAVSKANNIRVRLDVTPIPETDIYTIIKLRETILGVLLAA